MARRIGSEDGPAPPTGQPNVHEAPVLDELLLRFRTRRHAHVLDLGPASRRNLETYSAFAVKVRFLDLLGRRDCDDLGRLDARGFGRRLDQLLPEGRETFDLVLAWHVFDYLGAELPAVLAGRLAAISTMGSALHVMITTAETMPLEPDRFELAAGRLTRVVTTVARTAAPGTAPATLERWLRPFRVHRSVLLRHGVRETGAMLT